jgi:hypothetical protein
VNSKTTAVKLANPLPAGIVPNEAQTLKLGLCISIKHFVNLVISHILDRIHKSRMRDNPVHDGFCMKRSIMQANLKSLVLAVCLQIEVVVPIRVTEKAGN